METRLLESLLAVMRAGSFTAAADELVLAQSTVSAHLAELEKLAGTPLFERGRAGAAPTAAGRRLAEGARQILDEVEHAFRSASEAAARPSGTVTLSAPESMCAYLLVPVVQLLRRRHPDLQPVLQPAGTAAALADLDARRADLALVIEPAVTHPRVQATDLGGLGLRLVAAPGHRLASRRRLTMADLHDEVVLLLEEGCSYSDDLARRLDASHGTSVNGRYGSVETVKRLVEAELGIALLPGLTSADELRAGRLVALPTPTVAAQRLWLLRPAGGRGPSAAVDAVHRAVVEHAGRARTTRALR